MKLYGTTTSPFVRRVRIVAAELDEPVDLISTATADGQALLRELTPIAKVPVASIDGRVLFDSRAIVDWLTLTRGWGNLTPPRDAWRHRNLINAIDGALESAIQAFYLRRDEIAPDDNAFSRRQLDRVTAIFDWLGAQLAGGADFGDGLGFAEVSLICAIEWMEFRTVYPTARHPALAAVATAVRERPSFAATRPVA